MGWLSRRTQSARTYPAAGASVTGDTNRFRRSKTTGARAAGRAAEKWEQQDRARDRKGGWRRTDWSR
ncbi:hypothetical protein ACH49_24810 [Streptomyces leeuwenhoekii]|uniref:Uncharacterized protein n=1 Tax=Streptomyces leeuwenhoekii TaxID=1437453 RepID=A0ABR5HSW3_STRLW|nr:hypothetical protein [Streptomyces leeuwenhoekii]KMS71318.1 hypothetical protein ACH49_24810 [Streptomyces leeuwenhoekii]